MRVHPALDGLLKLRDRAGVLLLERDSALLALFHLEEGRLLKATGLIAFVPESSPGEPWCLLEVELDHLRRVEG